MNSEIFKDLITCTSIAMETFDSDDSDDNDIILNLLHCCEMALALPKKKNRKIWQKKRREASDSEGPYKFMMEQLQTDIMSFSNYLRMNKEKFEFILSLIGNDIKRSDTIMRNSVSPPEKLAAVLRFLATGESYVSTNHHTRLSTSYISRAVPEVCKAIYHNLSKKYLKFPNTTKEWEKIAEDFRIKWQFPNCLGALDGKHINFRARQKDGEFYYNYKGHNSIVLLALVDANCKFIYVDVGCNGRNNEAGVLAQSDLKNVLDNADKHFPKDKVIGNGKSLPYVIVADDAFPLQKHLIKPYPYNTTSREERIFNLRIARARQVVKRAFGLLANKFRILQTTMKVSVDTVEIITLACCALHNFLIEEDSDYAKSFEINLNDTSDSPDAIENPNKGAAEKVRRGFMSFFNEEGQQDWMNEKL